MKMLYPYSSRKNKLEHIHYLKHAKYGAWVLGIRFNCKFRLKISAFVSILSGVCFCSSILTFIVNIMLLIESLWPLLRKSSHANSYSREPINYTHWNYTNSMQSKNLESFWNISFLKSCLRVAQFLFLLFCQRLVIIPQNWSLYRTHWIHVQQYVCLLPFT